MAFAVQVLRSHASYVLLLLFLVNVVSYVDRLIVAAVLPLLQADLRFSDSQAGLLSGVAFAAFYATVGLPLGRYADRGNRRNLIAVAIAIWSGATALCGLVQNFLQLFLARVGVGVGEAGCLPASHSLISDYFPPEQRSSALGLQMAGGAVGAIVGLTVGGYVGAEYGWRVAFLAVGVPGLALALVVRATLREPPRGRFDDPAAPIAVGSMGQALRELLANRTYVQLGLAFAAMGFCSVGVTQWAPSYFFRYHDVPVAQIGLMFGLTYGVGSVIGNMIGGMVGDRLMRRDPRAALWFCSLAYAFAVIPGLGFLIAPTLSLSLGLNFVFSVLTGCATGPTFAVIQGVAPPRLRATASAVTMFMVALLGIGGGPLAVGVASDLLAPAYGADSLKYALILAMAALLLPVFHLSFATRTVKPDMRRAAGVV